VSLPYPTTDDAPELVAILPDWGEPIVQRLTFRTELVRSRRGLEQRTQHRKRGVMVQEYLVGGIHDADARQRLEAVVAMIRKPVIVPWWPSGCRTRIDMTGAAVDLLTNPITGDWQAGGYLYLWSPELGGEFRTISGVSGRVMSLGGTGTLYPAGSYCWPALLCTREKDDALLQQTRHRTVAEKLIFRTL